MSVLHRSELPAHPLRSQCTPLLLTLHLPQIGYPNAVLAAVVACKNGVKRAHLIDADSDG